MKYILFVILTLIVLSLFVKKETVEQFQGGTGEESITTQSLQDLISQINIDNNNIETDKDPEFSNLNVNSISDDLLDKFREKLNIDISDVNSSIIDDNDYKNDYNSLNDDIAKLKLINNEILRRKIKRKNKYHLKNIKNRLQNMTKYDENDKLGLYSSCPNIPFPYNGVTSEAAKYNLDILRHPTSWSGIEKPALKNKLPYNFILH
jgi:hypothetical protein